MMSNIDGQEISSILWVRVGKRGSRRGKICKKMDGWMDTQFEMIRSRHVQR